MAELPSRFYVPHRFPIEKHCIRNRSNARHNNRTIQSLFTLILAIFRRKTPKNQGNRNSHRFNARHNNRTIQSLFTLILVIFRRKTLKNQENRNSQKNIFKVPKYEDHKEEDQLLDPTFYKVEDEIKIM